MVDTLTPQMIEMIKAEEKRQNILAEINIERHQQIKKWGEQHHPNGDWLLILIEEIGEASQAMLQGRIADARKELVQSTAVLVAWLEDYENYG